ncbi:winged helix-turn-helix domain-containing protein [Myceligenerans pegani]|uniref:Helix-turn-helix transcriptional regulator n=1 Tax=Myceligenerans pegani TaxID=2776917 RepID=A0ABR9MT00_9MICO|nr:helix-turn-helix domain-containing protein [Myceligenerans sp. TRM 65318]MBE1874497.1 helix-turn-helix transcriptional regulator [Myceligenerans sp. TRM 65318]MBE3016768.1 helix-turn-helix transcriptional regulator [Myceligenerans sp. TRM 65318]
MTGANEQSAPADTPEAPGPPPQLGPGAIRALAHPLRLRILDLLSTRGSLTASKLGEIVGESSGSTSYHLRQLAKHGLVREVEGKGTARERWWERPPGGFSISPLELESPSARAAADVVNYETIRMRNDRSLRFVQRIMAEPEGRALLQDAWRDAVTFNTINRWATPEQVASIVEAWNQFFAEHIDPLDRREGTPDAVPVEIHFDAFPLIDGHGDPL